MNKPNNWGVSYSIIVWVERLLRAHGNVSAVARRDDIVFEIDRVEQPSRLTMLCCDQYTMGITDVYRAINEFGRLDIIYAGGVWCGYTEEAKEYCYDNKIGLFISKELTGALWKPAYWSYQQRDQDGNPVHYYK